jgi:hypothetical protein
MSSISHLSKRYSFHQQVKISQLEFRQQLMQQLIETYKQERSRIGRPPSTSHPQQQQSHWPQDTNTERDCVYCSNRSEHRKQSRVQCELCGVHLCIDCFKLYHQADN